MNQTPLPKRAAQLASHPLFANLGAEQLTQLASRCQHKTCDSREVLVSEGDEARLLYVLLAGSVRVYYTSAGGLEVTVKIFKAPAIFGEIEVISSVPHLENVMVLEPSELLLIPKQVFLPLLESCAGLAAALLRDVSARFCIAAHNERALAFYDVRTRLANYLISYAQLEEAGAGTQLRVKITQEEMAAALGVTSRAVAKEIARWKEQGVLSRQQGCYVILDPPKLSKAAAPSHLGLTYSTGKTLSYLNPDDTQD